MSQLKKSAKNVRSPRSFSASVEHLPESVSKLMVVGKKKALDVVDSKAGVIGYGLANVLWEKNKSTAELALETNFIQGIKSGLLDPTDYGGYTVQDAVYCSNATEYYVIARDRTTDDLMKQFIDARIKSYAEYTEAMFKQWHIKDKAGIAMGPAAAGYSSFEEAVAKNEDAMYLLIAMLPCEQLWGWLAEQIQSGIDEKNVYSFWISENLGGSHKLANFVNDNAGPGTVNFEKANDIYHEAMQHEVEFFASATLHIEN